MGRASKYVVELSAEQQLELKALLKRGESKARTIRRANTLLMSDRNTFTDAQISETLHVGVSTVQRTRRRFVEGGLKDALGEKPRGGRPNKWTERDDLELTAIACTEPPDGQARWTVRMLRDRFVELSEQHDSMSHERVRQSLKKTS